MAMIPKYAKMNKNPESSDKDADNYFDNKLERIKTKNKKIPLTQCIQVLPDVKQHHGLKRLLLHQLHFQVFHE